MNPSQAIEYLRQLGWTDHKIAVAADTTQPNIWRIRKGATPYYPLGAALVEAAKKEQRQQRKANASP